jgi:hypothetical protein
MISMRTGRFAWVVLICLTVTTVVMVPGSAYAVATYLLEAHVGVDCAVEGTRGCPDGITVSVTATVVKSDGEETGDGEETHDATFDTLTLNGVVNGARANIEFKGSADEGSASSTATSQGKLTFSNTTDEDINASIEVLLNWTMFASTTEDGEHASASLRYDVFITDKTRTRDSVFPRQGFPQGDKVSSKNGGPFDSKNFNDSFFETLEIAAGGTAVVIIDPVGRGTALPQASTLALVSFGLAATLLIRRRRR